MGLRWSHVQNNPIYLHALKPDEADPLKFDYLVYCSMDAIDDRSARPLCSRAARLARCAAQTA